MKKILLSLVALVAALNMSAQNTLTIQVGDATDLTKIPVSLIMTNEVAMAGFQASFALPEGLTNENFNEDDDAADTYCVLGDRAGKNHLKNTVEMFTATKPNDLLLSVTAGTKSDTFAPGSDAVATFTFDGSKLADGTYAVKLYGSFLLENGDTRYNCDDSEATFEIKGGVATGIKTVNASSKVTGAIYNVNGQKLSKLQKGINIVNGKKVYVK